MKERYDIVVVGAGVLGGATAALLADRGYSVALLGALEVTTIPPTGFDVRSYSLTPASRRILERLDVWPLIPVDRIAAYERVEVWDAWSHGRISFDCRDRDLPVMGYIVEHASLHAAVSTAIAQFDKLDHWCEDVSDISLDADGVTLRLPSGQGLRARLIVACDGADSLTRATLGIEVDAHAYSQSALVCNVIADVAHGSVARQRFLAHGPLAVLPLPLPDACAIVWTTSIEHARQLEAMAEDEFEHTLGRACDASLGAMQLSSARRSFALKRQHAQRYCASRGVLVGDAAHVVHPLAGLGLNLGLLDAAALHDVLRDPKVLDRPYAHLRHYARWRRSEALLLLQATDKINRLFSNKNLILRLLRGGGLRLTDRLAPLKHRFIDYATGNVGDLPRLARPG